MKETTNDFIPLIKFQNIFSDDYLEKIKPYEKLLSENLISDILKFSKLNPFEEFI